MTKDGYWQVGANEKEKYSCESVSDRKEQSGTHKVRKDGEAILEW